MTVLPEAVAVSQVALVGTTTVMGPTVDGVIVTV